jgi:hypothetical protein
MKTNAQLIAKIKKVFWESLKFRLANRAPDKKMRIKRREVSGRPLKFTNLSDTEIYKMKIKVETTKKGIRDFILFPRIASNPRSK